MLVKSFQVRHIKFLKLCTDSRKNIIYLDDSREVQMASFMLIVMLKCCQASKFVSFHDFEPCIILNLFLNLSNSNLGSLVHFIL